MKLKHMVQELRYLTEVSQNSFLNALKSSNAMVKREREEEREMVLYFLHMPESANKLYSKIHDMCKSFGNGSLSRHNTKHVQAHWSPYIEQKEKTIWSSK